MTATSGRKCIGSWTRSGPIGCLERTLLGTLRWASTECFLTWKAVNTPAGRLLFRLAPSMPRTEGSGSGLRPTAKAQEAKHDAPTQWELDADHAGTRDSLRVHAAKALWPAPQEHDKVKGDPKRVGRYGTKHGGRNLNDEAALWPTPRAITGGPESTERKQELGRTQSGGGDLQSAAKMWATPTGQDASNNAGPSQFNRNSAPLNVEAAKMWATPRSDDSMTSRANIGMSKSNVTRNKSNIEEQVGVIVSGQTTPSSEVGALNPEFVSWLMGYPSEWLSCAPSAMPSSRKSSRKSQKPSKKRTA